MTWNVLLPRAGQKTTVFDEVCAYGFRDNDPSLLYLSPWEFAQWFKFHRVRPPSLEYKWSTWTPAGKEKLKQQRSAGGTVQFDAFTDYVLNEKILSQVPYAYPYPPGDKLFAGRAPKKYGEFRHSWLILRRERPVVPCPPADASSGEASFEGEESNNIFSVFAPVDTGAQDRHERRAAPHGSGQVYDHFSVAPCGSVRFGARR